MALLAADELGDGRLNTIWDLESGHVIHLPYDHGVATGAYKSGRRERWSRVRNIGEGSHGEVWLEESRPEVRFEESDAFEYHTPHLRAVKVLSKARLSKWGVLYERELLALLKFSRPKFHQTQRFIDFHGWFEDHERVYIAMEYFACGTLRQYIGSGITENQARQIALQLLLGLSSMHAENYTHRDLKPENIFVSRPGPDWLVKIGDFGISKCVPDELTALRTSVGTACYEAPEVRGYFSAFLDSRASEEDENEASLTYTNAVDLWSLGCVVYELMASQRPFPNYPRDLGIFCRRMKFPTLPLEEARISDAGIQFVKRLLQPNPQMRPAAINATADSWVSAIEDDIVNIDPYLSTSSTCTRLKPSKSKSYRGLTASEKRNATCAPKAVDLEKNGLPYSCQKFYDPQYSGDAESKDLWTFEDVRVLEREAVDAYRKCEYAKAGRYCAKYAMKCRSVLGPSHLETLKARLMSIDCLYRQSLYTDAETSLKLVASSHGICLGGPPTDILTSMSKFGCTLHKNSKHKAACQVFKLLVSWRQDICGPLHRKTLHSIYMLGSSLHILNDNTQAVQVLSTAFERSMQTLGRYHAQTRRLSDLLNRCIEAEK